MHRAFPDLTWDATIKIEHLLKHSRFLEEMRALGCVFIVSAVESLSDRVLAILAKRHTAKDVDDALALVRAAGLVLRPSLLPFTPWSTLEDHFALLDFAERDELEDCVDPVQLTIRLLVPPGSLLEKHREMLPFRGSLDRAALTWSWTHPDARMDRLQKTVARIAADSARSGEDARETIARMREAALAEAGRAGAPRRITREPIPPERRAPRLTEPWFC